MIRETIKTDRRRLRIAISTVEVRDEARFAVRVAGLGVEAYEMHRSPADVLAAVRRYAVPSLSAGSVRDQGGVCRRAYMREFVEKSLLEFSDGLVELNRILGDRFCRTCDGGGDVSDDQGSSKCCGECRGKGVVPMEDGP